MPLTEAQKIKVRKILGVYQEMRFTGLLNPYDYLNKAFDALNADQITEVTAILAEYAKVEFSTGILSGDYQDDPANRRMLLKEQMIIAVNFNPKDYGVGGRGPANWERLDMGAADDIRAGQRARFQALEEAGHNNHIVEMFIFVSSTGNKEIAGKQGNRRYDKLTLKPNPEVVFNRREILTQDGFQTSSDVQLKGAFPDSLNGFNIVVNEAGAETASVQTAKTYASPKEFRADIERVEYFLIDGERYVFRAGGYMNIDKLESQWNLKLLKTDKQ